LYFSSPQPSFLPQPLQRRGVERKGSRNWNYLVNKSAPNKISVKNRKLYGKEIQLEAEMNSAEAEMNSA
jgi:hypothetical protein